LRENAKKDGFGWLVAGLLHDESGGTNYKLPPLNPRSTELTPKLEGDL